MIKRTSLIRFLVLYAIFFSARASDLGYQPISFNQFFEMPVGAKGLKFNKDVLSVYNQKVQLTGYMVQSEGPNVGQFWLSPRPIQMSEHADGTANDMPASTTLVVLDQSQKNWVIPHVSGAITVQGKIFAERYELQDGSVAWIRIHVDPQSIQEISSTSQNHRHQH